MVRKCYIAARCVFLGATDINICYNVMLVCPHFRCSTLTYARKKNLAQVISTSYGYHDILFLFR